MAFDAKQAVIDTLTDLEDKLKQAKLLAATEAKAHAEKIAGLESQIAGWQGLLARGVAGTDDRDVLKTGPAEKTAPKK